MISWKNLFSAARKTANSQYKAFPLFIKARTFTHMFLHYTAVNLRDIADPQAVIWMCILAADLIADISRGLFINCL